jgi:quercetin dioxygenase-like cupin family protein
MEILGAEQRPSRRGPTDWFTGTVWLDDIARRSPPARLRAVRVTFEPGARTAWHTHPFGQVLHILAGVGRVQSAGEAARTVKPGDTVVIAPGERHWHGASPQHGMVHLALHEADENDVETVWAEHVSDSEYGNGSNAVSAATAGK